MGSGQDLAATCMVEHVIQINGWFFDPSHPGNEMWKKNCAVSAHHFKGRKTFKLAQINSL